MGKKNANPTCPYCSYAEKGWAKRFVGYPWGAGLIRWECSNCGETYILTPSLRFESQTLEDWQEEINEQDNI